MLGSSTACLASLHRDQLETLNLGDSGFLLLRPLLRLPPMKEPGAFQIIHRTTEQAHRFNMPFQLGAHSNDLPEHGDRATFTVEVGDLLIMGTDGLWDNVFEEDILSVLAE
ncbi:hypothetical protein T484DRAFT_1761123 [Baffinella frigidus]|nr:hypothetical protein T484DRAFT_1761123 [Cryptophyta sp. CCMP2293]